MTEAAADTTWRGYSLAERDRRWNAVRAAATEAGFDCLLVPIGNRWDARYLTDMNDVAVVFPVDGRPPTVVNDRGRGNAWITQARGTGNRTYGPAVADILLELGMEHARIGVVGLKGGLLAHVRAPEGVITYGPYVEITSRLPNAGFEDATEIVARVRYVKGDEEIQCLRRATAIAEAGIDEMIEAAKPGADAAVMYGRTSGKLLELGSEHYRHGLAISLHDPAESDGTRYTEPPLGTRLRQGMMITNEVSAVWGGMVAQEDQPILLGPLPDKWKPVIEVQREVFEAGLEILKTGTTFGELIEFTNNFGAKRGLRTRITMHGRGNSDDGPLLTGRDVGDQVRSLTLERGSAFVWKPYGFSADGSLCFVWGGDVVVTDRGGQRLFTRPHAMVCV